MSLGPIFIIATPAAGSALLARALSETPGVMLASLDGVIDRCVGNAERLTADDATAGMIASLRVEASAVAAGARLVDASPRNIGRIPFLRAVFPDASFVYVYRDPRRAIEAVLAEDASADAAELARRWSATTAGALDDLERLPPDSWSVVSHRSLVTDPRATLQRIADFVRLPWDGTVPDVVAAPPVAHIVSPAADAVIEELTRDVASRARELFAAAPPRFAPTREKAVQMVQAGTAAAFGSVSTQSFPELLHRLGITLAVSTYQSGRLIFIRAENASTLNTHFRMFRSPMGIAASRGRLAIGTEREVWDYRNVPAVAPRVEPEGKHDACYLPRKIHVTGDIRIHEVGYAAGELWIVNTRFSTLCTLDDESSFVPRWRPKFVTHLAPEDRCHLNGMAIVDDRVKYVTAFGTTNTPGGWRENKKDGGLLIDVDSGETVLHGLSMPHSPRQYDGRFYVLESGKGEVATADLRTGRVETIAQLPGFTRGLAFAGPFAFVGLSQVRESNTFGGIPLTDRVAQRECGIYAIDLRNGRTVAFLRFEGDVQEIFDVQVLHGTRYPELLELSSPLNASSYTVPDSALAEVATRGA
jgi:uncharacterized protein (TIGR03032 family)